MSLILLITIAIGVMLAMTAITLNSTKKIDEGVRDIIKNGNINTIYADYKSARNTALLCCFAAFLLTSLFAVTFFSGGNIDPSTWSAGQIVSIVIGLVVTLSISIVQLKLYRSVDGNVGALIIVFIILIFVIFSEIATTSERNEQLIKHRSSESITLNSAVNLLNDRAPNNNENLIESYKSLAIHKAELVDCGRYNDKQSQDKCISFESRKIAYHESMIASYKLINESNSNNDLANKSALLSQIKELEYDESQNTAIVKFVSSVFGISALGASMFASFLLVAAFECGFHFAGSRAAILRRAINELGYTLDKTPDIDVVGVYTANNTAKLSGDKRPSLPSNSDADLHGENALSRRVHGKYTANTANNTANNTATYTANNTANKSANNMRVEADNNAVVYTANTANNTANNQQKKEHNEGVDIELMVARYEAVQKVKSGNIMICPTCEKSLSKSAHNKRFCSKPCKDEYHNLTKPVRNKRT